MSKRMTIRKGKKLHKIGAAIVAMLLVVAMVIGYLPDAGVTLAKELTSDLNTTGKFTESLGDNASTEYAGRVWTDKSVFTGDASFSSLSGETQTIKKVDDNDELTDEDDFLVSFSALATAQSVTGQAQAPIDVVFVIDMSGSMRDNSMSGQSRLKRTITALNTSIETLMATSEYARVGVVAFSGGPITLLELDHYTKLTDRRGNAYDFISTDAGENNIYARAVGVKKGEINLTKQTSRGTNIQRGIFDGMNMLASVPKEDTIVEIDKKEVKRVPSIVLLSDGAPTIGSDYQQWWDLSSDGDVYSYDDERPLYGMLAILTASYMKAEIDRNYGVEGTASATKVYSIGMGINDISESWGSTQEDENLAFVTIDPKTHINKTGSNNIKAIRDAWATYQSNNFTGRPVLNGYEFIHPDSTKEVKDIYYVDKYYDADNATAVTEVFNEIVSSIKISAPEVPTEHDVNNPMTSGYITYTDPIGEYMEVKTMKAVIYDGEKYLFDPTASGAIVNGTEVVNGKTVNTTTYKFSHPIEGNPVYGDTSLASLLIKVRTSEENGIKKQELEIKIPAGLIPLRVNTVELDEAGDVKSHTNNGAYPIRVLYTVGLQDAVLHEGHLDMTKISDEYLTKHPIKDGHIQFYSNLYTGTNVVGGHTAGDATVEFDAADTNQFYYMQKDTVIYADTACTEEAREIRRDGTYYYQEVYYHGNEVETKVTVRTGAELLDNTTLVKHGEGADTYWVRPAGTVRVNNMLKFKGHKLDASGTEANLTETADDFYAATYDGTTGHFKVYLGNNGVMSVEATGSLEISKAVTAADGLTAPDKDFTFTVELKDEEGTALTGTYSYIVTGADGKDVRQATVKHGETITLKANQKATIVNLPSHATYRVVETVVAGFDTYFKNSDNEFVKGAEVAGTIIAGTTVSEEFENRYSVTSTSVSDIFKGKKVLKGRAWAEGDEFTFMISGVNNAPMPAGYENGQGITVTKNTKNQEFDFGTIEFTKPGLYRYTVYEQEPENHKYLPGMTYSKALYSVTVSVVDSGDGTLSATTNVQKLYEDDATPLFTYNDNQQLVLNPGQEAQDAIVFTNTYNAESVVRVPVATKNYTDHSGRNPLRADMFGFKLTALGKVVDGQFVETTEIPMPASSTTTNEGANITFLPVTFTHADVPEGKDTITYRYQMEEVIPEGATENEDGTFTLNGMTYDGQKYVIDVKVSIDPTSNVLDVDAVYPNDDRVVRFTNVYDPEDTDVELVGMKYLFGREYLESDSFIFELKGADGTVLQTKTVDNETLVNEYGSKEFAFDKISYDKPGTYTYTIAEQIPADADKAKGVTYDTKIYDVTVEVKDNNGKLEPKVYYNGVEFTDNSDGAVFENEYKAEASAPLSLEGTKVLTGRPLKAGQFYFTVAPVKNDEVVMAEAYKVSAQADGKITFLDKVTYDTAGTYTYRIWEDIPENAHGVTYDPTVYNVTVEVEEDYVTGKLVASITNIAGVKVVNGEDTLEVVDVITFNNTYEAAPVVYDFLPLQKVLSGVRKDALKENEFEFVRTGYRVEGDETSTDGIKFYKVDGTEVGVSGDDKVKNAADGTVAFGDIQFTKVGTYVVTIKEEIPEDDKKVDGVTYDRHELSATFEVTDNLAGNLQVRVTEVYGSQIFRNEYKTTGYLEGSTNLTVTKILDIKTRTPNTWTDNDKFTFILEAGDESTANAIANREVILPTTSIEINRESTDSSVDPVVTDKVYWKQKAFGNIEFHAVGSYTFNIREVAGTELGMDYDATVRKITIRTVDNGDGTLQVIVEEGSQTNPTFTNVYNINDVILSGHDYLHVNKVFTGRPDNAWKETDKFIFTLEAVGDTLENTQGTNPIVEMSSTSLEVTRDNKNVAHFGNITFNAAGTYEFMIKETPGTIPGVAYDSNQWKVTVVVGASSTTGEDDKPFLEVKSVSYVKLNSDGEVIQKATNEANLTFKNTYSTVENGLGEKAFEVVKVITGRNWLATDVFTFTLEPGNAATREAVENSVVKFAGNGQSMTVTIDNNDEYKVVDEDSQGNDVYGKMERFDDITFTTPGTYTFVIKEDAGTIERMQYDNHVARVVVVVSDNGDGVLSVDVEDTVGTMTWTNTFTPESVTTSLVGTKTIAGRTMTDEDVFQFHITANNDLAKTAMTSTTDVTNAIAVNNEASITFGPLTFKSEGTYEYVISERTVNTNGITSDTGYVKATVVVTYDATTGLLSAAAPTYEKVQDGQVVGTEFKFVNNYFTEGILDGSTHLKVTKNFTGRPNNAWLAGDSFTFTLAASGTTTEDAVANGEVILPDNAAEGITISYEDVVKEKAFGSIRFTKAGDYQFFVREVVPEEGIAGVSYDKDAERDIYVKVVDNGNGTLTASVVRDEEANKISESLTFNNVYDTNAVTLAGLEVEKSLVGREWIDKDTYSFTLKADQSHSLTAAALEGENPVIVMPAAEGCHVTITKATENHKATFGNITFKEPGVYKFIIAEDAPETKLPGVTYDSRIKHITVTVVDKNDGQLEATAIVDNHDDLVFVNTYKASYEEVVLTGMKQMAGDRTTLNAKDRYSFTISAAEGTPLPAEVTVTNAPDGTITFAPITFTQVGTYTYTITENIPAEADRVPGVTYAQKPVTATVTVMDYNVGYLESTVVYSEDGFVFTNTYNAEPVNVSVEGTKTVEASPGNSYTMTGGEFKFRVVAAESNPASDPLKEAYEVSNSVDGTISIINTTYTESGTYIYSVSEVDGANTGISEDSSVYTITVNVVDNGEGKLEASTSFEKDGQSAENISFNNTYNPTVTSVTLHGLKRLKSEHKRLEAGLFNFNVTAISGPEMLEGETFPMPAVTTVTHDATGVFQFGAIEFTKPGTYVYEIGEDTSNQARGYSYDSTKYTVTVVVTDVDGNLSAAVSGLADGNNNPLVVFTNGYEPETVTATLKGTKTLTGRDLQAGEFKFELKAAEGTPMPTKVEVANAEDGGFSFEPITFSEEGTCWYTISEVKESLGGVTYDEAVYTVKVVVADEGGYLAATVTYLVEGEETEQATFVNAYSARPTKLSVGAEKILSGRDLNEKEFSFKLMSGDEVLQTKENTATGVVAFDEIEYNAVGEYVYTIVEVAGDKGGVTYDTNKFEVTVNVTDNLNGNLEAEVVKVMKGSEEVTDKKVVFENKYAPSETSITLTGKKTLTGRELKANEFTFLLKNDKNEVVGKATNAADGTITFEALSFTQVGTFEYTVVEDSSAQAEGIVYDDSSYKVVVNVKDNLEGKLVAEVVAQEEIIFKNQFTEPDVVATKLQAINGGNATVELQEVKAGDMITYTIKFVNNGSAMAKNIVLTDKVPAGLDLIVGTVKGGDAIDVAEDGTITWKIFRLEAGKTAEVSFQVTVPAVKEDTTWTNVATYVYDNNPDNPENSEEPKSVEETNKVDVKELVPRLEIVKKQRVGIGFATDKNKTVKAGDKVVYYITVTNDGNGDAEYVTITDRVPEGLNVIEGSISENGILKDGVITWNFDAIEAGEKVTVEFAVKVPSVTKDTVWKNVAAVVYGNAPEGSEVPVLSNEVIIDIKESVAPITGDTASITMWLGIAFASILTVVTTVVRRRRTN